MRIALTSFGTTGDNAPFLALAEALRAQGDEPLLLLNPRHEAAARARGLAFAPVGPWWAPEDEDNAKYLHPRRGAIAIWTDFYLPNVARTFAAVDRAIAEHRADVVVAHWMCFGAHFAARRAGVPLAVVTLAPCWWYSRADPSNYTATVATRRLRRWMQWLPRAMVDHFIGRSLRGVCAELGVPHRKDVYFETFRGAAHNLGLWAPAFRGPAADDPPRTTLCGFPCDDAAAPPLDAALERFLDAGDPPVTVGLGSAVKTVGHDLYREIGVACRERGRRAVLVGATPAAAAGLDGVLAVPAAPYSRLFARSGAVLHHGGIGTLAEALRAGRPSAVIPFVNDQFDNARRAAELGVSLTLPRGRVRGRRLRALLDRLTGDATLAGRAAALGERLRAEPGGAEVAARAIAGR